MDYSATLSAFFLRHYFTAMFDPQRNADDQLEARFNLEALLLQHAPYILRPLQAAIDMMAPESAEYGAVARWFLEFTGSLQEEWLRETRLSTIERLWRGISNSRIRRAAADRIIQIEYVDDPNGTSAHLSLLVSLFLDSQPDRSLTIRSSGAAIIIEALFARIRYTPPKEIPETGSHIARYALRVLGCCFKDPREVLLGAEADAIVELAGEMNDDIRTWASTHLSGPRR